MAYFVSKLTTMPIKNHLTFFFSSCVFFFGGVQQKPILLGVKSDYYYSGLNNFEAGIGAGKLLANQDGPGVFGYHDAFLNVGVAFNRNQTLQTTRVGYEYAILFLCSRVSVVNYTDFHSNQVSFIPEIGLTWLGWVKVYYGYNFYLSPNAYNLSHNSISVGAVFPIKSSLDRSGK